MQLQLMGTIAMRTTALPWNNDCTLRFMVLSSGITLVILLGLALFAGLLVSAADEGRPEPPGSFRINMFDRFSKKPQGPAYAVFDTSMTQDFREKWEAVDGAEPPRARVAIIIDDMGYGGKATDAILSLSVPLTISVLPGLKKSIWTAREAHRRGFEVMLHMPMEAENSPVALGPYGITVSLSRDEIRLKLIEALGWVPNAVGINNHMGSKATKNERIMSELMPLIKELRLFYVDSRTALHSIGMQTAQRCGVPTTQRNVFLDNVSSVDYIKGQLKLLITVALKNGTAVGIGHTRHSTAQAIKEMIPLFRKERIDIVPVSELLTVSPGTDINSAADIKTVYSE